MIMKAAANLHFLLKKRSSDALSSKLVITYRSVGCSKMHMKRVECFGLTGGMLIFGKL